MLGRGKALSEEDYIGYGGPLTAGTSALQDQAYQGLGSLGIPQAFTAGSFTGAEYVPPTAADALTGATAAEGYYGPASGNVVQNYMNPYLEAALEPQYAQAAQDYGIAQRDLQSRFGNANAYGGSRQGVAEGILGGEALRNMSAITGRGYEQAYANAQSQFDADRTYGLGALKDLAGIGNEQRAITAEGVAADYAQFEDERDDPFKKVQYARSLLQGLPLETQSFNYSEPSGLQNLQGALGDTSKIYTQLEDWWKSRGSGSGTTTGASAAWTPAHQAAFPGLNSYYIAKGYDAQHAAEQAMRDLGVIT
tara:strand:+ start:934 stop:1857 length:924 start_codon:yes stop_codon:yes gene_type:complete